jgi:hypothetical protein
MKQKKRDGWTLDLRWPLFDGETQQPTKVGCSDGFEEKVMTKISPRILF